VRYGKDWAETGTANGASGKPAGAEKQHRLQRAVEPQFSPFEQLKEGEEAVNDAETRANWFGSGNEWNLLQLRR
jgi:hypothetical protein